MTFVRAWKRLGRYHDVPDSGTAEVHFADGRVVQVTCSEGADDHRGDGMVMLRVWGPGGTAEYGGDNLEDLSLVVRVGDDETKIESLRYGSGARRIRASHERPKPSGYRLRGGSQQGG